MDEAVLRIQIVDEGGQSAQRGGAPSSYAPTSSYYAPAPAPPAAYAPYQQRGGQNQAFDPSTEARKLREAEVRREQIRLAYDRLYSTAERTNRTMDLVFGIADKMRGTLGGAFGPLVGSLLDVYAAMRRLRDPAEEEIRLEATRRNAGLDLFAEHRMRPTPSMLPQSQEPAAQAATAAQVLTANRLAQTSAQLAELTSIARGGGATSAGGVFYGGGSMPVAVAGQKGGLAAPSSGSVLTREDVMSALAEAGLDPESKEARRRVRDFIADEEVGTSQAADRVMRALGLGVGKATKKAFGGEVPQIAGIPAGADEVPVMATADEFVVRKSEAQRPGNRAILQAMNAGHFAEGGDIDAENAAKNLAHAGKSPNLSPQAATLMDERIAAMISGAFGNFDYTDEQGWMGVTADSKDLWFKQGKYGDRDAVKIDFQFAEWSGESGDFTAQSKTARADSIAFARKLLSLAKSLKASGIGIEADASDPKRAEIYENLLVNKVKMQRVPDTNYYFDKGGPIPTHSNPDEFPLDPWGGSAHAKYLQRRAKNLYESLAVDLPDEDRDILAAWLEKNPQRAARGGDVAARYGIPAGSDEVPIKATSGEFIVNREAAQRPENRRTLERMNRGDRPRQHYASGGTVTGTGDIDQQAMQALMAVAPEVAVIGEMLIVLDKKSREMRTSQINAAFAPAEFAADPNTNPAKYIAEAGDAFKKWTGDSGALGMLGLTVSETTKHFAGLMDAIDKTANRYGEYSAPIAQAQALADVQHTMGEMRRAQVVGPEMARYLQMQVDLQQKYEDVKVKILVQILPIVTAIGKAVEVAVTAGSSITDAISALSPVLNGISVPLELIAQFLARGDAQQSTQDPTDLILGPPNQPAGGPPPPGPQVPNL